MTMKKTSILVVVFLSTITSSWSQTRIGFKAGFTLANMRVTATDNGEMDSESGDAVAGFHLGGIVDMPAGKNFHIRPELLIVAKGSSFTDASQGNSKVKLRPYYLEVPVNFLFYKTFPRSGASIFLGGGPALSVGIGGKATANGQSRDVFNEGLLKRFDLGLGLQFGFDLANGLTFGISTNSGLLNIYDESPQSNNSYDVKFHNSSWNLSIGYLLQ